MSASVPGKLAVMSTARSAHEGPPPPRGGLVPYIVQWALAGAVVAVLVLLVLAPNRNSGGPTVSVPPVREIALPTAARKAGCVIEPRGGDARNTPATMAATGGQYDSPLARDAREASLRRGIIVIEYRAVDSEVLVQLQTLQRAVPSGTVLAPGSDAPRRGLTVSSYRRVLRCPRVTPRTLDALRLFRGRYLGVAAG